MKKKVKAQRDYYVPITLAEYQRFLGGALIGRRKYRSYVTKTPLYESKKEAIRAYKRKLNPLKGYQKRFVVLQFTVDINNPNVISHANKYYWLSSLSNRRFFTGATHYCKQRTLIDILYVIAG